MVNQRMDLGMRVVSADATKPLPFEEKEFDFIYQCGLLEHFSHRGENCPVKKLETVHETYGFYDPNAASIAYRTGKAMMEQQGIWSYGLELPQYSLGCEFEQAGIHNIKEYTIGAEHAFNVFAGRTLSSKGIAALAAGE